MANDVFTNKTAEKVANLIWNGTEWVVQQDSELFIATYDYSGATLIYSGKAAVGSKKVNPVWQIKKYLYSGNNLTDVRFADNSAEFAYSWDLRDSYNYL